MANVYIEPRPKGRQQGSPIEGYVVEDHADSVPHTCKTKRSPGRSKTATPLMSLVCGTSTKADHWRKVH
jgi:hypothetical protein